MTVHKNYFFQLLYSILYYESSKSKNHLRFKLSNSKIIMRMIIFSNILMVRLL